MGNILLAVDSDGQSSAHATKYDGGSDLCDIAVSPDGLSVGMGFRHLLYAADISTSIRLHVRESANWIAISNRS